MQDEETDMTANEACKIIDNLIFSLTEKITKYSISNKEYDTVFAEASRLKAHKEKTLYERGRYKIALVSLTDFHESLKKLQQEDLECSLTNTINAWYEGANYDFKFETSSAGKAKRTFLIDDITGSDLNTVCGGSAKQVTGLLDLNAILLSKNSNFIFLDEACSNTDEQTASDIGKLLQNGLGGLQTIVVENKTALTDTLDCLTYYLKFDTEKGGAIIQSIDDPYDEIPTECEELARMKNKINIANEVKNLS